MKNICTAGITIALAALALGSATAAGVEDRGKLPPKHDSNTLHKIGNAIQYPIRKAGENVSISAHRGTGQNSVVKDQKNASTEVLKPSGKEVVIAKDNPRIGWTKDHDARYMHRRADFSEEGRTYYWFQGHRYYFDPNTGQRIKID